MGISYRHPLVDLKNSLSFSRSKTTFPYLTAKLIWQDALLKSNEVFETFKQEIEKVHYTFFNITIN